MGGSCLAVYSGHQETNCRTNSKRPLDFVWAKHNLQQQSVPVRAEQIRRLSAQRHSQTGKCGVLRPLDSSNSNKQQQAEASASGLTMDYPTHLGSMMTLPLKPWHKRGRNQHGGSSNGINSSPLHHHHSSANAASRSKWKDAALLQHSPPPVPALPAVGIGGDDGRVQQLGHWIGGQSPAPTPPAGIGRRCAPIIRRTASVPADRPGAKAPPPAAAASAGATPSFWPTTQVSC
jgi:hypothetical protein